MKWLICTLAVALSCSFAFGQSGWTVQNSGTQYLLWSVKAVDLNVGWACGEGSTVIRTNDGGTTWRPVVSAPFPGPVYDIDAVDSLTAIATCTYPVSGGNTFLFRTTNGGASWVQVCSLTASGAFINAVRMFDHYNGLAVGDPVEGKWVIFRTTNGGATWSRSSQEPVQSGGEIGIIHGMATFGGRHAWFTPGLSGNHVYRTTDAGETWSSSTVPFTMIAPGVCFVDSLTGFVGSSNGIVVRTTDGGVSWQQLLVPGTPVWGISGFRSQLFMSCGSEIYTSSNLGDTWDLSYTSTVGPFMHVSATRTVRNLRAWAVTQTGGIVSYYGQRSPTPGWTVQNSGITNTLWSVDAVDQNIGWATTASGGVVRTTDGGENWQSVGNTGAPGDNFNLTAIDSATALVTSVVGSAGGNTYIYRTTDGGRVWVEVFAHSEPGAFLNAITMIDSRNGVAVGDPVNGKWVILRTTDAGATWNHMQSEPPQVGGEAGIVHGLATIGLSHLWFTPGAGNNVYRTTNGGASWSYSQLPFAAWTPGLWFIDTNVGVAGSVNGNVARSTDGGVTWNLISIPGSGQIWSIAGLGSTFFLTRGSEIYQSTDGGINWELTYSTTSMLFTQTSFTQSGNIARGWAVGSSGFVVSYYATPTGARDELKNEIPSQVRLYQNYPNPFNPSTTIKYTLPEQGRVKLSIYNLLGQEVETLFDESQEVGAHSVVWNADRFASGVYFYRLSIGKTVLTKKLVLMK